MNKKVFLKVITIFAGMMISSVIVCAQGTNAPAITRIPNAKPRNIVFILTDDHRYDAMGFVGKSFVETPNMDAMARNGVHMKNAVVTTALCSPSRATILTGKYAHRHKVVDNGNPIPPGTIFFSQYLKKAGYDTAFIGKWHMGGEGDDPKPGFDKWVSFKGQGTYLPSKNGLNVDGKRVPQKGYITDEMTDYAVDWLKSLDKSHPFMLYLSHKGVHSEFIPADRHKESYKDKTFTPPQTMSTEYSAGWPMWVQNQRNSWHGVDFPYHSQLNIAEYYKSYMETLRSVDDSIGRVVEQLRAMNVLDSTLIIYMGDNGFAFGEHGLIDKRTAYEESMRVPMLIQCPELFKGGGVVEQVVANLDIAPTVLEAAGIQTPEDMNGRSFVSLAQGKSIQWRESILYEYYWERAFPQTPSMHALRGQQYKYIRYYGIWDTDELYDLKNDPLETTNLINNPEHQRTAKEMYKQLFQVLEQTGGMYLPLSPDNGGSQNKRTTPKAADFPSTIIRKQ